MGYTHTFRIQPGGREYADAWPYLIKDAQRIITAVIDSHGIVLSGHSAGTAPLINASEGICFNGDISRNLHLDTFTIAPPGPVSTSAPDDCLQWRHVKTECLPYDLAVTGVLLRMRQLMPRTCAIGGSGSWHRDWAKARTLNWRVFGTSRADLEPNLLVDTTDGMAISAFGLVDPRLAPPGSLTL